MTETMPPPLFDPFAPGFTDDPYPQYAIMREQAPVYQHPFGFWLLTGYDGVSWLLRATGLSVEDRNLADSPFVQLREATFGEDAVRPVEEMSMLDRDPPDHTRMRRSGSSGMAASAGGPPRPGNARAPPDGGALSPVFAFASFTGSAEPLAPSAAES